MNKKEDNQTWEERKRMKIRKKKHLRQGRRTRRGGEGGDNKT